MTSGPPRALRSEPQLVRCAGGISSCECCTVFSDKVYCCPPRFDMETLAAKYRVAYPSLLPIPEGVEEVPERGAPCPFVLLMPLVRARVNHSDLPPFQDPDPGKKVTWPAQPAHGSSSPRRKRKPKIRAIGPHVNIRRVPLSPKLPRTRYVPPSFSANGGAIPRKHKHMRARRRLKFLRLGRVA